MYSFLNVQLNNENFSAKFYLWADYKPVSKNTGLMHIASDVTLVAFNISFLH